MSRRVVVLILGLSLVLGSVGAVMADAWSAVTVAELANPERVAGSVSVGKGGVVTLRMAALPSSDCWYEVGSLDDDGKPGGSKTITTEAVCP